MAASRERRQQTKVKIWRKEKVHAMAFDTPPAVATIKIMVN
ncbi:hypothetical protein ACFSOZ_03965 [Mesorhizobium newzealandense]|uniref:Uncharacterized protein n=3 Tax=Mesorhizobium TaxID=68287 RepID=A0ABW4WHJ3_9HYPH|nr:hypothetical protein [Mesorhizobium sophorae]